MDRTPIPVVSLCLNAGGMGRQDFETETMIPVTGGFFDGVSHSLKAEGFDASEDGTGRGTPLVFDSTQITSPANGSNPKANGPCPTLAEGSQAPAIAFMERGRPAGRAAECQIEVAYAQDVKSGGGPGSSRWIGHANRVRRLTPTECERLQGFPDGWTDISYKGKRAADSPRYKAIGNSIAVNASTWVLSRISMVEAAISQKARAA